MVCCKLDDQDAQIDAFHCYAVLNTEPEAAFDRITRLAQTVAEAPIVLVSLIDQHRQWFKSRRGINSPETIAEAAFTTPATNGDQMLIVRDTHADSRFAHNPLVVNEPHIRSYIGVPLRTGAGRNVGALCAMDTKVRDLRPEQIRMLEDLAHMLVDALELRRLAMIDSLTGALTHRSFYERARRTVDCRCGNTGSTSCAVVDIDGLQNVNDVHGRAAGDVLLQHVASMCKSALGSEDYVGRIGGDEFALMLPGTSLLDAFEMANRLRQRIATTVIDVCGWPISPSVSIGIAESLAPRGGIDSLLRHANAALDDAKLDGKNRVACHLADLKVESGSQFDIAPPIADLTEAV